MSASEWELPAAMDVTDTAPPTSVGVYLIQINYLKCDSQIPGRRVTRSQLSVTVVSEGQHPPARACRVRLREIKLLFKPSSASE